MSISLKELTFSDIPVIDNCALNELVYADSYQAVCQAYFEQALMPLSMISFNAYLDTSKLFLFAIRENIDELTVGLLSFFKSLFLVFEKKELNNLIYSLEQIFKCIAQVVLDVCYFSLLCALTLISLPIRILSTLVCYSMAIANLFSSNLDSLRTYSNYSNIDPRINSRSNSVGSNERNSTDSFEDEPHTDPAKIAQKYFSQNPCCI